MPMHCKGLTKAIEEMGELIQVLAKKQAYLDTDIHPDGLSLRTRMEEEIADVRASLLFIEEKFDLDTSFIDNREIKKLRTYRIWDADESS